MCTFTKITFLIIIFFFSWSETSSSIELKTDSQTKNRFSCFSKLIKQLINQYMKSVCCFYLLVEICVDIFNVVQLHIIISSLCEGKLQNFLYVWFRFGLTSTTRSTDCSFFFYCSSRANKTSSSSLVTERSDRINSRLLQVQPARSKVCVCVYILGGLITKHHLFFCCCCCERWHGAAEVSSNHHWLLIIGND